MGVITLKSRMCASNNRLTHMNLFSGTEEFMLAIQDQVIKNTYLKTKVSLTPPVDTHTVQKKQY